VLLRNNGDGTFSDDTVAAGLNVSRGLWGTSCAFVDVNGDGWLDLYVADYVQYNPKKPFCRYGKVEGGCTPGEYQQQPKLLFMNLRDGTFQERGKQVKADNPKGAGLGVVVADFDNDGGPDIFVANDGTPNALLKNSGGGQFQDIALTAGVGYSEMGIMAAGMGTDAADINGDERVDIIVTNFQHEPNALYRNLGAMRFTDGSSFAMSLGPASLLKLGFGVSFFDYDLDGDEDIYVGNGHVFDNVEQFDTSATYAQEDQLFENIRRERFRDRSVSAGTAFRVATVTRGVAIGDIDNNGTPDVLCNDSGGAARLLVNEAPHRNHWIGFHLLGTLCNRAAIGARVRVETPRGVQVKEVRSGSSYLSQSDFRLRFGLGDLADPRAVQVRIRWPGGGWQTITPSHLDDYMNVREIRS
jgi:hypothetical protein